MESQSAAKNEQMFTITEEHVKEILRKYGKKEVFVNYSIRIASDKMLGFLADYFRLEIHIDDKDALYFFIKATSRSNLAKAAMVKELKSFEKETLFYSEIKKKLELSDLKPWSARYITFLEDAIVFEDLNAFQYKTRNKFQRFDMPHVLQALKTLARFHASSLIFEEKRRKEIKQKEYCLTDDFPVLKEKSGYRVSCAWLNQCKQGALEAIRTFSNFDDKKMAQIESHWANIWIEAITLSSTSKQRMVICHRDLWNNNLLFHYRQDFEGNFDPDDCVLVDFQAYEYDPPASDVMLLLYCNLERQTREQNMGMFLNYYYEELEVTVMNSGISLECIISKEEFFTSAEEYRKFALIVCSCLMPQLWIEDNTMTNIFSDTERFYEILSHNKAEFIKSMMEKSSNYKDNILEIFEEIVERYCF